MADPTGATSCYEVADPTAATSIVTLVEGRKVSVGLLVRGSSKSRRGFGKKLGVC